MDVWTSLGSMISGPLCALRFPLKLFVRLNTSLFHQYLCSIKVPRSVLSIYVPLFHQSPSICSLNIRTSVPSKSLDLFSQFCSINIPGSVLSIRISLFHQYPYVDLFHLSLCHIFSVQVGKQYVKLVLVQTECTGL